MNAPRSYDWQKQVIQMVVVYAMLDSACGAGFAQSFELSSSDGVDLRGLARELANVQHPRRAAFAIRDIRRSGTVETLARLIEDPSPNVSLFAMWEGRNLTYHRELEPALRVQRFLGAIEGRLRVNIPEYWQYRISQKYIDGMRHGDAANTVARFDIDSGLAMKARQDVLVKNGTDVIERLRVWPQEAVSVDGESLVIHRRGERTACPRDMLTTVVNSAARLLSVGDCDGDVLLAACYEGGQSYNIWRIHSKSGAVRWRSAVWCTRPLANGRGSTGTRRHDVEFVSTVDAVYVFGWTSDDGPYLEGFDKATGEASVRFAANGWGITDPAVQLIYGSDRPPQTK